MYEQNGNGKIPMNLNRKTVEQISCNYRQKPNTARSINISENRALL